jgi:hypothetical protein
MLLSQAGILPARHALTYGYVLAALTAFKA